MLNQGRDIPTVLQNIGEFGPLARAFKNVEPEQIAKAKEAIAEALQAHTRRRTACKLAGACWLVRAQRG